MLYFYIIFAVRIIALKKLKDFWEQLGCGDSESSLRAWYNEMKNASWNNSNEVKKQYRSSSVIGNRRIVFNIKGNKYRLVAAFDFEHKLVFIRFIGPHREYDKID